MFEIIEGKRLVLRKAKEKDLLDMFEGIWSDEEVYKYLFITPALTLDEAKIKLKKTIDYQKDKYAYLVALKENDEAVGFCGIKEIASRVYMETGLALSRKVQGKGLGEELLYLLLEFAYYKLGAYRFIYAHMEHNIRSKNLCLKFGFKHFERVDEIRDYDGFDVVCDYYYLDREDYEKEYKYKNKE